MTEERVTNPHFCTEGGGWIYSAVGPGCGGGSNCWAGGGGTPPHCSAWLTAYFCSCLASVSQAVNLTGVTHLGISWYHYKISYNVTGCRTRVYVDNDVVYETYQDSVIYPENIMIPISYSGTHTVKIELKSAIGPPANGGSCYLFTVSALGPALPVADFSGIPLTGDAPLVVAFTDLTSNAPTSWVWNFGGDLLSYLQNPTHEFLTPGVYTITLTTSNGDGSDTEVKTDYVTVIEPLPPNMPIWTVQIGPL